jgi:hypothetical protein
MADRSPSVFIPRSTLAVGVEPGLRPSLRSVAAGRAVVIDATRFRQCGTWVGSLDVAWRPAEPGPGYVELEPIEGVRVFAAADVVGLLRAAGATLGRGGLPFRRGLRIELARPDLWIDYLERPASFPPPFAPDQLGDAPPA